MQIVKIQREIIEKLTGSNIEENKIPESSQSQSIEKFLYIKAPNKDD